VQDIEAARVQLVALIEQLNIVSKERFGDVFRTIQEQFAGESGMFRRLFGGGKADVRLMPLIKEVEQPDGSIAKVETEEIDLLESGIEVIAKPPGKEPRAISQLSGGEKTLTAVALLMSIFRSKPSCFCVLDEVDAALDEGNVGRFNSVIRDFTDRSAFIVITHNKRTMQNADHLYGVTMQERGVSTRVSVRFEEVGKDGKINAPAKPEEKPAASVEAKPAVETPRKAAKPRRQDPSPVAAVVMEEPSGAVAVVAEPPVVVVPAPATIVEPSAEDRRAGAPVVAPVVTAPLGIGESPDQQTTLGMSPLKRALAKLREMQN
jgi:chromosome segregation protein